MALDDWMAALEDEAALPRAALVRAIARLSAGLTGERVLAGVGYLDDAELRAGYLVGYWPVSYAQGAAVLDVVGGDCGRVLDVGAGCGAMSAACADRGATSLVALDPSRGGLGALGRLFARVAPSLPLETRGWHAGSELPRGPFDTIIAGHLLNELPVPTAEALVDAMHARLAPGGRLVLIEPALRATSRGLLALRDRLVAAGAAVLAPCFFRGPCPALLRAGDWCHAKEPFDAPARVEELAAAAGLHRDRVKMSYVVFAPAGASWPAVGDDVFRIVSEPLPEKGKLRRVGCGPRGRHFLVLPDRARSADNAVFAELARGDVVSIDELTARGDGLKLAATSHVIRK